MEPPESDPLVGIVTDYVKASSSWYFRVNFTSRPAFRDPIVNCYLRADTSDPTKIVFHNIIRMAYKSGDRKVVRLQDALPKDVLLRDWVSVVRDDIAKRMMVDEAEVAVSPSEVVDLIQVRWASGIKAMQHQRIDIERVRTFPSRLAQAIMLLRSLPSSCRIVGESMADGLTEAINIHPDGSDGLLWSFLLNSASRDAVRHLCRVRNVRFAWEV